MKLHFEPNLDFQLEARTNLASILEQNGIRFVRSL